MARFTKIIPVVALLTGATVWGLIWYPYRVLAEDGIGGAVATTVTYGIALLLVIVLFRPRIRLSWMLLAIALAAGWANVGFTMAVVYGDVMRVVLLFYLSPIWTILFARWLLGERLSAGGYALMGMALAGAAVMLWEPALGWPLPRTLAEWTGLSAGAMFACSNVLIRKTPQLAIELKVLAAFFGGVVAGTACMFAFPSAAVSLLPSADGLLLLAILAVVLLAVNIAVQYGLTHISANRAIVIYLFELVVTAFSAWLLADEVLTLREWVGGIMIITAGLLSDLLSDASERQASACSRMAAERPAG